MIRLFKVNVWCSLMIITLIACSQFRDEKRQALSEAQTFTKKEYDEMRMYFSADTLMQSELVRAIHKNDSNAILLQKLMATEYEKRSESGISDREIKAMILSYQAVKSFKQKFAKIDSTIPKTNAQEVKQKKDSVLRYLDGVKDKLNR